MNDGNVDIVVIATPNDIHAAMVVKAFDVEKHVVVEKPMCLSTAEADKMIEASKRNQRLLSVRHNRRWDTDFLTVKHVLDSNMLGNVFSIDSAINMYIKPNSWRATKEAGGGHLIDWGCHLFDQIVLLARSEPEKVFAVLESRVWDVDVDTHARVLTTFKNGLTEEVEVNNVSWLPRPRWHIRGEKGALIYLGCKAWVKTADGEAEVPNIQGNLREFYQNLAAAVNNGEELLVKPEEARTTIAIIEAAFLPAEKGEAVDISNQ